MGDEFEHVPLGVYPLDIGVVVPDELLQFGRTRYPVLGPVIDTAQVCKVLDAAGVLPAAEG